MRLYNNVNDWFHDYFFIINLQQKLFKQFCLHLFIRKSGNQEQLCRILFWLQKTICLSSLCDVQNLIVILLLKEFIGFY